MLTSQPVKLYSPLYNKNVIKNTKKDVMYLRFFICKVALDYSRGRGK